MRCPPAQRHSFPVALPLIAAVTINNNGRASRGGERKDRKIIFGKIGEGGEQIHSDPPRTTQNQREYGEEGGKERRGGERRKR